MRTLPTEPNPGDKISASLMRDLIRAIREMTPIQGPGISLSSGPNGTVFSCKSTREKSSLLDVPFKVRHVEQDSDAGIPYTGWEIYLPTGCVTVNSTCEPLNPRAYRQSGGSTDFLEGWYRLPDPDLGAVSLPHTFDVVVRAKCNAAHYGTDEISTWPKRYVWADISNTYERSPGDTLVTSVGYINYPSSGSSEEIACVQTVFTPVAATASTNGRFELVHSFTVNDNAVSLELAHLYVRNPSFSAAGRTIQIEDLSEIDKECEAVYLKIDTENGVASLKTYSAAGGDTIDDQVEEDSGDFDILVELYRMDSGSVVYDDRQNLNNVQVYK